MDPLGPGYGRQTYLHVDLGIKNLPTYTGALTSFLPMNLSLLIIEITL